MILDKGIVLDQIDSVLKQWREARSRANSDDYLDLPRHEVSELITLITAAIERLSPPNSVYRMNAQKIINKYGPERGYCLNGLSGILYALRSDYEADNMKAIHELIHAEVFSDFLEMSDYFIGEGYKDPAAVMAGSVLEGHLRNLCLKNDMDIMNKKDPPMCKKADSLNSDLARDKVYSKIDQKSITHWMGIRNSAAHGKYSEYTIEQVNLMIQGIRDFIVRNPA